MVVIQKLELFSKEIEITTKKKKVMASTTLK
jgi:hypothetical protein